MRWTDFRLFRPILAGATLRGRLIGCVGALLAIGGTGWLSTYLTGSPHVLPYIVAPMGASAVLLFAVPSSPLAQPWPVIGGNVIATLVGIAVAKIVPDPYVASALAVGLAILAMSLTRTLHPPGGAAALTAVIGGPAVTSSGFAFAFMPVALNSVIMVLAAIAFHRLTRTSYPHRPVAAPINQHGTADQPPYARVGFTKNDVDAALASLDETFDIDRDDLTELLHRIELQALDHSAGSPACGEIMSRDVVTIGIEASADDAIAALLAHNIRTLPVLDLSGGLAGTVGLRELVGGPIRPLRERLSPAHTVPPTQQAIALLPTLTDGRCHAVIVVAAGAIVGIVSQTDLLATLYRSMRHADAGHLQDHRLCYWRRAGPVAQPDRAQDS